MKLKIAAPLTEILLNRIYISRSVKVFSLKDIADNWTVSRRTLFRYDSPRDREVSRLSVRPKNEKERTRDKSLCQICSQVLAGHERCGACTILLHDSPCLNDYCIDILVGTILKQHL